MEAHLWAQAAQTTRVRVCTAHGKADPQDPNVCCEGFEARFERLSSTGFWIGEKTGERPVELVIQQIRSGQRETLELGRPCFESEVVPVGHELRLLAVDGSDLHRVLGCALSLAKEQSLFQEWAPEPQNEDELTSKGDDADALDAMADMEPPLDEAGRFAKLASQNRIASLSSTSSVKTPASKRNVDRTRNGGSRTPKSGNRRKKTRLANERTRTIGG